MKTAIKKEKKIKQQTVSVGTFIDYHAFGHDGFRDMYNGQPEITLLPVLKELMDQCSVISPPDGSVISMQRKNTQSFQYAYVLTTYSAPDDQEPGETYIVYSSNPDLNKLIKN